MDVAQFTELQELQELFMIFLEFKYNETKTNKELITIISVLFSIRNSTRPKPRNENNAETQLAHVAELNIVDTEAEKKLAIPDPAAVLLLFIFFRHP
ncbi:MAG: hypothetical protein AABX38_04270 [Candidatus Micrarchaeota archaeon]